MKVVNDQIIQNFGDLVVIRCECGAEVSYVPDSDDVKVCACGRRYRLSVVTTAYLLDGDEP